MFTLFHLFQLLCIFLGALLGAVGGMKYFSWVGLIIGGSVGLCIGTLVGAVPAFLAHQWLLWDLKRTTT